MALKTTFTGYGAVFKPLQGLVKSEKALWAAAAQTAQAWNHGQSDPHLRLHTEIFGDLVSLAEQAFLVFFPSHFGLIDTQLLDRRHAYLAAVRDYRPDPAQERLLRQFLAATKLVPDEIGCLMAIRLE